MGSCRAATITGTLSRISLNDEEDEKAPEGLNYSTLPGNIISKVIIQQPSALHMPMGVGELKEQCMADSNADMRRTVYLCTDDAMRQSDQDMGGHDMEGHPVQGQMMETDYIVMPRASAAVVSGPGNVPTLLKEDKMNIAMDTLSHERLMHYKMSPDFNISPSGMDHMNVNLEQQYPGAPEQMQNLPFEPRTAVKNFLAEMEESAGLSRSETGSTISMSSLEVRLLTCMKRRGHSLPHARWGNNMYRIAFCFIETKIPVFWSGLWGTYERIFLPMQHASSFFMLRKVSFFCSCVCHLIYYYFLCHLSLLELHSLDSTWFTDTMCS